MTGLTGNSHLDECLLLRVHAGCVASGALGKPDSFVRLISEITLPLTEEDVILGGKDDEIIPLFFEILLFPLAAQGVIDLFFGKRSDIAG
jgi:hypothetical protein